MTTTDSNGIVRFQDSDGAPTPPVLNLGLQSVSDAITGVKSDVAAARRAGIYPVASSAARGALISQMIANNVPPTTTNPVYVYREDVGVLERTINGTSWTGLGGATVAHTLSLPLWSSSLTLHREVSSNGFRITARGRMSRTAGSFTLNNNDWVGIGSASMPDEMRCNVGPNDIILTAQCFPTGGAPGTPITVLLNTGNGNVSLRSPASSQFWDVGGFFQIEGGVWFHNV